MVQNIIVVGGGVGGTMTANNLVAKLYPEIIRHKVRVTLISNSPWHYTQTCLHVRCIRRVL